MNFSLIDLLKSYLRELSSKRGLIALCFFVVSIVALPLVLVWPKSYTATSTIYADNSNILAPLMQGTAVATNTVNQARMAREILFKREFTDRVLEAAGWDIRGLSAVEKEDMIESVQDSTKITNVGRNPARLIRIDSTDVNPVRAFRIAQIYTTIFIQQSVIEKQIESKNAFQFIQDQVSSYKTKLQESEDRLSRFKSDNNNGTLKAASNRIAAHRSTIERIELELVQLNAQKDLIESQLEGEVEESADLAKINAVRSRINALQLKLDALRSRFFEDYPDVIQVKTQMQDLMDMIDTGKFDDFNVGESIGDEGISVLHQELRSRQTSIDSNMKTRAIQLEGIESLLVLELERSVLINDSEAELAELTRDYNVTRNFYNTMLNKLENARVSMRLDEQEQGVTFKVQEPAIIPSKPDGLAFSQLLILSFMAALAIPLGLLVVFMELDPRIKSESGWKEEWPPLLMTIPQLDYLSGRRVRNKAFISLMFFLALGLYAVAWAFNADILNLSTVTELKSFF